MAVKIDIVVVWFMTPCSFYVVIRLLVVYHFKTLVTS